MWFFDARVSWVDGVMERSGIKTEKRKRNSLFLFTRDIYVENHPTSKHSDTTREPSKISSDLRASMRMM
jgi:hypothetical protein